MLVVRRQTAAGHDTVNVRMSLQGLSPGMQDTQKAEFGPSLFRISGDFLQRGGTGFEEQSKQ